jgi:5-methylcytosine-specific restriction protein B
MAEPGLSMAATLAAIRAAAERRGFVTYGAVAAASGLPWSAARRRMDPHLFALCRWATARGWPLLSAIVVDQRSVAHGAMRGRPLIGFARAAERLGRIVGEDAAAFLAEEQARVFAWAGRAMVSHTPLAVTAADCRRARHSLATPKRLGRF